MSQTNDNPSPKLDRMLRQWGAEEAADRAPIGHAPREPEPSQNVPAPRKPPWLLGLGTLALAAAAVVGFVILMGRLSDAKEDANAQVKLARRLEANVMELQRQLKTARDTTVLTAGELQREADRLARDANEARLAATLAKESLTAFGIERAKTEAKLTQASEEAAAWKKKVEEQTAKLNKALDDANVAGVKLAAAAGEIERERKLYGDSQTALTTARAELEDLKARNASALSDFQQAYLAAAAPGETGLKAAQTAVRRSQLIERIGKARQAVDASQRPLLDKLEVVLTRLEMLEPSTFVSEDMFKSLLQTSGVMKQIDEAMGSPSTVPQARAIYFEARLILMGAQRVG